MSKLQISNGRQWCDFASRQVPGSLYAFLASSRMLSNINNSVRSILTAEIAC